VFTTYSKEDYMQRYKNREARVIPIILRPTDWKSLPFNELQVLPTHGEAVTSPKEKEDEAFLDIARAIRRVVNEILNELWMKEGNALHEAKEYN